MQNIIAPIAFNGVSFDIVDRNGQPWLRSPQIAEALGYAQANRVSDIYARNADEFTDSMTALVKLQTQGGVQEVRVFSLRGAHLIGMLARTARAAAFRRWILDILEKRAEPEPLPPLPYKEQRGQSLTEEQCAELRKMLTTKCETLPHDTRANFMVEGWSRLKSHFGCSYRHIPQARYAEALGIAARHCAEYQPLTRQLPAPPVDPFDRTALLQAREWAENWMAETKRQLQEQPRRRLDAPALPADHGISDEVLCGILARAFSGKTFIVDFRVPSMPARVTLVPADRGQIGWNDKDVHEVIAHNLPADKVPATIAALAYRGVPALLAAPQAA